MAREVSYKTVLMIGVVVGVLVGFVCGMIFMAWLNYYIDQERLLPPHDRPKEAPQKWTIINKTLTKSAFFGLIDFFVVLCYAYR